MSVPNGLLNVKIPKESLVNKELEALREILAQLRKIAEEVGHIRQLLEKR